MARPDVPPIFEVGLGCIIPLLESGPPPRYVIPSKGEKKYKISKLSPPELERFISSALPI